MQVLIEHAAFPNAETFPISIGIDVNPFRKSIFALLYSGTYFPKYW